MNDKKHLIGGKAYKESDVVILPHYKFSILNNDSRVGMLLYHKEEKILYYGISASNEGMTAITTVYNPKGLYHNLKVWNGLLERQHLYILSDEEIKDGDWCYNSLLDIIVQADWNLVGNSPNLKKIITSTDKTVCYPVGNGNIDSSDPLPRPSDDFLKKYCELGGIDKVLVEYETIFLPKEAKPSEQEHCFELKVANDNTITIKPFEVKESWNNEEVKVLLRAFYEDHCFTNINVDHWIKEKNL